MREFGEIGHGYVHLGGMVVLRGRGREGVVGDVVRA